MITTKRGDFLNKIDDAKKELKYFSIDNEKTGNDGLKKSLYFDKEYERSFCFYYTKKLSLETVSMLFKLVYNIKYQSDLDKMVEGWYLVEQDINEVESNGMCPEYECTGYFGLLNDYIEDKEKSLLHYKSIYQHLI